MTNTSRPAGAHRTEASSGTVEGTAAHRRGTVDPSAGAINRSTWATQAALTWTDVQFRQDYRSRRADLRASMQRLGMGGQA
jgi:hypothetical protein